MKFIDVFGDGKYISATNNYQFPYIRKSFYLNKPVKRAELFVSVLGFAELYVNEKKLTDDLYLFPYTQYNKQSIEDANEMYAQDPFFDDDIHYSISYNKYEIQNLLEKDKNVIGIIISGGWYRSGKDKHGGFRNYGNTKACFRLKIQFEDGDIQEILSDEDCRWKESFLLDGGIFHESQDERKEIIDFSARDYDDSHWDKVCIAPTPIESEFRLNECPNNKIIRYLEANCIKRTDEYAIYDLGENITGFPILESENVHKGDTIFCVYSEELDENLELNEFHSYNQNTSFISDGRKTHHLRFTWHGFRYFKVWATNGKVTCTHCAVVYADIKNTSTFDSDSPLLNWIYKAYVNSQLQNFQCGLPTDCPQIERKGYTGDGQLLAELGMMLFDSKKLYQKWMQDISDCQDAKTGFVHYTAPCFIGCGGGPGGWSIAIISVPYTYYKTFGDCDVLRRYYPQMQKYLQFMQDSAPNGLVEKIREGWCLGDWESPRGRNGLLPTEFVNTCFYILALKQMVEIAEVLEKTDDIAIYTNRIKKLKETVDAKFYDPETGDYCENDQGANAIALKVGLGDVRTTENLAKRYNSLCEFDTGIFATKYLIEMLMERGYPEVAYKMLTSEKECSYASWKKQGATTLFESWRNARSYNHPMFGSVVQYFFNYLLGIRQANGSVAYRKVEIKPLEVNALKKLSGSLQTASGEIFVSIERLTAKTRFLIFIPENMEAVFTYKGKTRKLQSGKNEITI